MSDKNSNNNQNIIYSVSVFLVAVAVIVCLYRFKDIINYDGKERYYLGYVRVVILVFLVPILSLFRRLNRNKNEPQLRAPEDNAYWAEEFNKIASLKKKININVFAYVLSLLLAGVATISLIISVKVTLPLLIIDVAVVLVIVLFLNIAMILKTKLFYKMIDLEDLIEIENEKQKQFLNRE